MRKFSKIFESKETLLSKLGSSEDEIKDMCTELTDEGYEIKISTEYIGADGHIYYTYGILIRFHTTNIRIILQFYRIYRSLFLPWFSYHIQ